MVIIGDPCINLPDNSVNHSPLASAGTKIQLVPVDNEVMLPGMLYDDLFTGSFTSNWNVLSGPGTVTFDDQTSPSAMVSVSQMST